MYFKCSVTIPQYKFQICGEGCKERTQLRCSRDSPYCSVVEMAKWGEGDPRWIVEERPDGTNVNNWHWAEKNADSWSKQKIKVW